MICPYCGATLLDNAQFCEECGARQNNYSAEAPRFDQPQVQPSQQQYQYNNGMPRGPQTGELKSPMYVDFGAAIKLYFSNALNFSGRSTRSEYWFGYLLNVIAGGVASWFSFFLTEYFSYLVGIVLFIPLLSAAVRRLHDIGKSGWWWMINLTCVGAFVLLYWYCQPGSKYENQWGPSAEQLHGPPPSQFNNYGGQNGNINNYNNHQNYNNNNNNNDPYNR